MNLLLRRRAFNSICTIGDLFLDGVWSYYTLEDEDRYLEDGGLKVPGRTAIPRGTYTIVLDWSNRFKRFMPHLLDVPQFEGIRIHSGNYAGDTEGCILVGKSVDVPKNAVYDSRAAFRELYDKLDKADGKEKIVIEIV